MTDTMGDDVLRFEPDAEADLTKLAYTFGGFEPLVSVRPGTTVSTWTMDCFAGRVRSTADMVSQVCDPRFLNPQTGPFYVEGAEPGDTLVVHFRAITPRESQGVSTTVPLFGSLTTTPFTAMLHPALPERTQSTTHWTRRFRWTCRSIPCTGPSGSPRPSAR